MFRSALLAAALGVTTGGTVGVAATMSADAPMTWFIACTADAFDHSLTGGRVFTAADSVSYAPSDAYVDPAWRTELVGPVAATREGASRAIREGYGALFAAPTGFDFDAECEPVHVSEIWQIGVDYCDPIRQQAGHPPLPGC